MKGLFKDEDEALKFIACLVGVGDIDQEQWDLALEMFEQTRHIDISHLTEKDYE